MRNEEGGNNQITRVALFFLRCFVSNSANTTPSLLNCLLPDYDYILGAISEHFFLRFLIWLLQKVDWDLKAQGLKFVHRHP